MTRPRLLDLFCGAGGAAMGYHRAGFDVTGWDNKVQPHYPFLGLHGLHQGDALAVLADLDYCRGFDVIHASPPCQAYTDLRHRTGRVYPRLIDPVRDALIRVGRPWIIENVEGAPLRDPLMLCGSMFGLVTPTGGMLKRHRLFESPTPLTPPQPDACAGQPIVGVYGTGGKWTRTAPGGGGVKVSGAEAAHLLGINWTHHQAALAQAIPPAYTQFIGEQLLAHLGAVA